MLSSTVIALMLAVGGGTWVYTKMSRQTGGQAKPALIVAGTAAFFLFLIALLVLNAITS